MQTGLKDVPGFVNFTCHFTCKEDTTYIEAYSKPTQRVCTSMSIIVMPYYPLGSLEEHLRERRCSHETLKTVVCKVLRIVFKAYATYGFTHGDLFPKNVLMVSETEPILCDYEKSQLHDKNKVSQFWRDLDDFLGDVSRYAFKSALDALTLQHLYMNLATQTPPSRDAIERLCADVQRI